MLLVVDVGNTQTHFGAVRDGAIVEQWRLTTDRSSSPDELAATSSVRTLIVGRVRRCVEAGRLRGDETDVAHVFVGLIQGMAFAEAAGRLGTSTESVERRWRLALGTLLNGFGAQRGRQDPGSPAVATRS